MYDIFLSYKKKVEKVYNEAFVEIEEILKLMPIDLVSKIPVQFRKVISENKSTNYKCDIKEPLEEQKLKKETIVILGLIYRDYLSSPEERERMQIQDSEELKKIEQEMNKQYKNKYANTQTIEVNNKEFNDEIQSLIIYKKPNFIKKFFGKIKRIFKKDKF